MKKTQSVYLIRDGELHKIGKSRSPQDRMSQVAGPGAELVHVIRSESPAEIELALHRRFARSRAQTRGREWFRLSQDEVALIRGVAAADSVDDLPRGLRPVHPGGSGTARLRGDLVEKLRVLCFHKRDRWGRSPKVAAFLDGILRPTIDALYAEYLDDQARDRAPPADEDPHRCPSRATPAAS